VFYIDIFRLNVTAVVWLNQAEHSPAAAFKPEFTAHGIRHFDLSFDAAGATRRRTPPGATVPAAS
jgi:hypothetical protein